MPLHIGSFQGILAWLPHIMQNPERKKWLKHRRELCPGFQNPYIDRGENFEKYSPPYSAQEGSSQGSPFRVQEHFMGVPSRLRAGCRSPWIMQGGLTEWLVGVLSLHKFLKALSVSSSYFMFPGGLVAQIFTTILKFNESTLYGSLLFGRNAAPGVTWESGRKRERLGPQESLCCPQWQWRIQGLCVNNALPTCHLWVWGDSAL